LDYQKAPLAAAAGTQPGRRESGAEKNTGGGVKLIPVGGLLYLMCWAVILDRYTSFILKYHESKKADKKLFFSPRRHVLVLGDPPALPALLRRLLLPPS
jgi:hypothetical protein